jgi:hypothetical protein
VWVYIHTHTHIHTHTYTHTHIHTHTYTHIHTYLAPSPMISTRIHSTVRSRPNRAEVIMLARTAVWWWEMAAREVYM